MARSTYSRPGFFGLHGVLALPHPPLTVSRAIDLYDWGLVLGDISKHAFTVVS